MKRLFPALLLLLSVALSPAPPPDWWTDSATAIVDPNAEPSNYSPANLGQLKHVAVQAREHLDALPGGAGSAIDALIESFEPREGQNYTQQEIDNFITENYAPINLGQLKAVAKPFYDRLIAVGYDTQAHLIARGYPSNWSHPYPWNPATPASENYAPANLGQLKLVFSFDISEMEFYDDWLPDDWEQEHFSTTGVLLAGDPDGDGRSNLTEYLMGSDPNAADGETGPEFSATGLKVFTPLE